MFCQRDGCKKSSCVHTNIRLKAFAGTLCENSENSENMSKREQLFKTYLEGLSEFVAHDVVDQRIHTR